MKAVILAAGHGTRLRPVTLTMPKSLVPVANKFLIVYALDVLRNAGITDIGIVVNNLASPIVQILGEGREYGVHLSYIVQEEQKGLAHATAICRDFVGDEPFCVYLGDNIFQDKMRSLLQNFASSDAQAALGLGEVADPTRFGIAEVKDGQILRVLEKPKNPPSNLAICGVYLFRKSIFDAIGKIQPSARGEYEITDAIQVLLTEKQKVIPYKVEGWWIDAGKPNAIIEANQFVLGDMPFTPKPEGANIIGKSEVSSRVVLGKDTQIIDSVIRGPVILGDNVTIKNSYIGPYTSIGNNVTVENSEIEASIIMRECTIQGIPGRVDSSLIADNSIVTSANHNIPATHRFILAENSYVQL